jgi:16S rRNA (uracil1498-N3)-methyltransferase
MNILLFEASELEHGSDVTLADQRAHHLLKVLKVGVGDTVRIGVLDGLTGHAEVIGIQAQSVTLRCQCDEAAPPAGTDSLLLGFARPKVLLRCLEHATALGFGQIVLFRSRRVEKSHLSSHALEPGVIEQRLRHGLEQSRRTQRPKVHFVPRFRQLIEELDSWLPRENRFVADADAASEAALARVQPQGLHLVIGPEGGLIDHELEQFSMHGFEPVRAGQQPLRVETAVAYLSGQLRAARTRGA